MIKKIIIWLAVGLSIMSTLVAMPSSITLSGTFSQFGKLLEGSDYFVVITLYSSNGETPLFSQEYYYEEHDVFFEDGYGEFIITGYNPDIFTESNIIVGFNIDGNELLIPLTQTPYAISARSSLVATNVDWSFATLPTLNALPGTLQASQIPNRLFTTDKFGEIDASAFSGDVIVEDTLNLNNHTFTVSQNYVGFGVIQPQYDAHVSGIAKVTKLQLADGTSMTAAPDTNLFTAPTSTNSKISSDFDDNGSGEIQFYIATRNVMTISNSGHVGIGVSTPAVPLEVVGTLSATYLVGAADYITGLGRQSFTYNSIGSNHVKNHAIVNRNISANAAISFDKLVISVEDIKALDFVTGNSDFSPSVLLNYLTSHPYLVSDNMLSDLGSIPTARANLGLGTLALLHSITSSNFVPRTLLGEDFSDDANIPFEYLDITVEDLQSIGFSADDFNLNESDIDNFVSNNRYMVNSNNLSDLANASTARSNLGLGSLAVKSTISSALINNNAITTNHLIDGSLNSSHFSSNSIGSTQLGEGAIISDAILDGTLTNAVLATGNYSNITGLTHLSSMTVSNTVTANYMSASIIRATAFIGDGSNLSGIDASGIIVTDSITTEVILDNTITSEKIASFTITNSDISSSAAIDASKISGFGTLAFLNTLSGDHIESNTIVDTNISESAAIPLSKVSGLHDLASQSVINSALITNGSITSDDFSPSEDYRNITQLDQLSDMAVSDSLTANVVEASTIYLKNVKLGRIATRNTLSLSDVSDYGDIAGLDRVNSGKITNFTITNVDIADNADISITKLDNIGHLATLNSVTTEVIFNGSLLDADFSDSAAIALTKIESVGRLASHNTVTSLLIEDGTITDDDLSPGLFSNITQLDSLLSVSVNGQITANAVIASGNFIAGYLVGDGSSLTGINSDSIANGSIIESNLEDRLVTGSKFALLTLLDEDFSDSAQIELTKVDGFGHLATLNSVDSSLIEDNTITSLNIAVNAITASELSNNSVDTAAFQDDAVTTEKIANTILTNSHFNASAGISVSKLSGLNQLATQNTVNSELIQDGTITSADFSINSLTDAHFVTGSYSAIAGLSGLTYLEVIESITANRIDSPTIYLNGDTLAKYATINIIPEDAVEGLGYLATQNTISNDDWSGTILSIPHGGTQASTTLNARSNLGLAYIAGDTFTGTVTVNNDLIVDTSTFYFDYDATHLGLNTNTPAYPLDVHASGSNYARLSKDNTFGVLLSTNDTDFVMGVDGNQKWSIQSGTELSDSESIFTIDDDTGYVGINESSPVNTLDVSGKVAIGSGYAGIKSALSNGLIVEGKVGISTAAPSESLDVAGTVNASYFIGDGSALDNVSFGSLSGVLNIVNGGTGASTTINARSNLAMLYSKGDTMTGQLNLPSDGLKVGTSQLVVNGSSVGIHTATPVNTLDVNGGVAVGNSYAASNSAPSNGLIVEGFVGINHTSPSYAVDIVGTANSTDTLVERLGIGKTAPSEHLHLAGGATTNMMGARLTDTSLDDSFNMGYQHNNESFYFYKNDESIMALATSNIDIYVDTNWKNSSDTTKAHIDPSTGDAYFIGTLGVNGIANPTYTLDVSGNVLVTQNVLVSNGLVLGSTYATLYDAPSDGLLVEGHLGLGLSSPINTLDVSGNMAIGSGYAGIKQSPTDGLLVQGFAGIGTSVPNSPFHVAGALTDTAPPRGVHLGIDTTKSMAAVELQNSLRGRIDFNDGTGSDDFDGRIVYINSSDTFKFDSGSTAGDTDLQINLGSVIVNSNSSPVNNLDIGGNSVIGDNYLGTYTAPTDGLLVEGFVGVGTTNPAYALDIVGTLKSTNLTGDGSYLTNLSLSNAGEILPVSVGGTGVATIPEAPAVFDYVYIPGSTMTGALMAPAVGISSDPSTYNFLVDSTSDNFVHFTNTTAADTMVLFDTAVEDWAIGKGNNGHFYISPGTNLDSSLAFTLTHTTGKLGIGHTQPINALDVNGNMAIGASYSGNQSGPANSLIVQGNTSIGTDSNTYPLQISESGDAHITLESSSSSQASQLLFADANDYWTVGKTSDGRFGFNLGSALDHTVTVNIMPSGGLAIGTANAEEMLHIYHQSTPTLRLSTPTNYFTSVFNSSSQLLLGYDSTTLLELSHSDVVVDGDMVFATNQGSISRALGDLQLDGAMMIQGSDNSGSGVYVNGDIDSTGSITGDKSTVVGKVMVNTSNTTYKLNVEGDAHISNDVIISGDIIADYWPEGTIVAYYGNSIPTGYELADGTCSISCPDLRYRFIYGSTAVGSNASSGGSPSNNSNPISFSTSSAGDHTHTFAYSEAGEGSTGAESVKPSSPTTGSGGAHTHTINTTNYYYELAYIIKVNY